MKINLNNLRKQSLLRFDELTKILNYHIIQESGTEYAKPNGFDYSVDLKGFVVVDAEDIRKQMDDLRQLIGSVAMVYEEGVENFADVYEQAFPEDGQLTIFDEQE